MLVYNVAALMQAAPGTTRHYPVRGETMTIAEDLPLAAPIDGDVHLSRTGRSILARADLTTAVEVRCSRCLTSLVAPIVVGVDEEALPSIDFMTGAPMDVSAEPDALRIDEHHELDLTETVREAISLAEPIAPLCREACAGLCVTCGADLNADPGHAHHDDEIDPRLAVLASLTEARDDGPDEVLPEPRATTPPLPH